MELVAASTQQLTASEQTAILRALGKQQCTLLLMLQRARRLLCPFTGPLFVHKPLLSMVNNCT